jgi:L-fuconolactonase
MGPEMGTFPIIDSHVHLYDPVGFSYPWMSSEPKLNKVHSPSDFTMACGPIQVDGIVFVEVDTAPKHRLAESEWVTGLALTDGRIKAIVAAVPLELGEAARPDLELLAALPLVRGIRRLIQSEPDPDFCLRSDFVAGVKLLAKYDLSFDICVYHHQLRSALELVRQCPEIRFVLDHVGKPDIRAGSMDPWRSHIRELSALPNVWCKLSGMATEADHKTWRREDLRPYIDHVIDCFSFSRLMFGGDWPVSTLATDYPRWVETVLWATASCSEAEQRRLFRETAAGFYRLS